MVWFGLCFGFVLLCFVLFRFDIVLLCSEFVVGFIVFYFCCVSVMFRFCVVLCLMCFVCVCVCCILGLFYLFYYGCVMVLL